MLGTHDLMLFIVSGLLLNIAPGPDSLLIVARSASQGWRGGSAAAFGIGTGTFVHVLAAALGLSALLATSATAFAVVKIAGAAYLLYIGIVLIIGKRSARAEAGAAGAGTVASTASSNASSTASSTPAAPYRKIFAQGFLTNVLNPKVAMFFLAFVPQFIDADAPNKALAFVFLGAVFYVNSMLWCNFLAVSTALASQRIRAGDSLARWINRAIGALFVSFGLKLALAQRG